MGSLGPTLPPFTVLDDTRPDDMSLPAFMVSTTRGFLPRMDPIATLPAEFDALESLLQRMPVKTASGEPGLLAHGGLGDAVAAELPDLTDAVDIYKANLPLMNALYRDYSFLASAYLLEPCHLRFVKGEPYGLGRDVLPANIARPIAKCAALCVSHLSLSLLHSLHPFFPSFFPSFSHASLSSLSPSTNPPPFLSSSCGFQPFMEYAGSYALFNYRLVDPSLGLTSSNRTSHPHCLLPLSAVSGRSLAVSEGTAVSGSLDVSEEPSLSHEQPLHPHPPNNNTNPTTNPRPLQQSA